MSDDATARPHQACNLPETVGWIRLMDEESADERQIERTWRAQRCRRDDGKVRLNQRDGLDASLIEDLTRQGQRLTAGVKADDSPVRSHLFSQHK